MKKANNTFLYKPLFILIIIILIAFSACSRKKKGMQKLYIAVVNRKEKNEKIKPITVSIMIDNKNIISKQVMKTDRPLSIIKSLKPGNHTIKITEGITGAIYKANVFMDGERWLRVVFYREGKGMGHFDGKIQEEPWGYEFEKTDDKVKKKIREERLLEDDFDKKLDELEKEKKKNEKEKNEKKKIKNKHKSKKKVKTKK